MSHELGASLANVQERLTSLWIADGPDATYDAVAALSRKELEYLAMANIGASVTASTR